MKTLLITGASGTVGGVLLERLSPLVGWVIAVGRRSPSQLPQHGVHLEVDLGRQEEVTALDGSLRRYPTIDTIVLCAGVDSGAGVTGLISPEFLRSFQINCTSHICLVEGLLRKQQVKRLKVVVLSTSLLNRPEPESAVYAVSKAALEEAVRCLAVEDSGSALRAIMVRLPYIGVPMRELADGTIIDQSGYSLDTAAIRRLCSTIETFLLDETETGEAIAVVSL